MYWNRIGERNLQECEVLKISIIGISYLDTQHLGVLTSLDVSGTQILELDTKPLVNLVFLDVSNM